MPFNANTFDLASRSRILAVWTAIAGELESSHQVTVMRPTRPDATNYLHLMNRVRAAFRAQKEDGHIFDHISAKIVEVEPPVMGQAAAIVFTDRSEDLAATPVTLLRADGSEVRV